MEKEGESEPKPTKQIGGQLCQICGDTIGTNVDGEAFVACDVCAFPVCRPCYEYERKDGNQSCPQCKTKYKRHKGSPPIRGDEVEDAGDVASDVNYSSRKQDQKQKMEEHMLSWHMSHGRGEDVAPPRYDKEVSLNNIPLLTNGRTLMLELHIREKRLDLQGLAM